ncbi:MAG TPA: SdrD B-like domain-containing protein, partial [Methylomirabilota bacterium]|nr:SdrD B-like domain-containing protein [Methylomirabilota bacterium]
MNAKLVTLLAAAALPAGGFLESTTSAQNICFNVSHPGAGQLSYFTARLNSAGALDGLNYQGWCIDTDRRITTEQQYTAKMIWTTDLGAAAAIIEHPENLDLVNFILNQEYPGKPSPSGGTYTFGDVQRALWTLLDDRLSDSGLREWSQLRVDEILLDAATNGEGFVPGCGDLMGLILNPVLVGCDPATTNMTTVAQIVLVPVPIGCLGDYVWLDKNVDGIQDADEAGIPSVTVNLLDCQGNILATTTTDANGFYLFSGLIAGNYNVQVVAPGGYVFTAQDQGTDDALDSDADATGMMACTALAPGETDLTWDAGLYQLAAIGDRVWLDGNVNGVQDAGEPGIPGVTVKLMDCQGNILATTVTDASGNYLFSGLVPGQYNIQVVAPAGYLFTSQYQGGDAAQDSDADATGLMICTTLDSGETDLTWDAGLYQTAAIGDLVWVDINKNGIQDAGEAGLPGVTVLLADCAGNQLASTTTDANGNYLFSGLLPGNYNIQIVIPTGYVLTSQDQGADDALDSDANNLGVMICTTLESGETDLTWDAGVYKPTLVCTRTQGYWKTHPEAWPVEEITIGDKTYTKAEAIAIMKRSAAGDKRFNMFEQLVAAKLNLLAGTDGSCISDVIAAADVWWIKYGKCPVKASSYAWSKGGPL